MAKLIGVEPPAIHRYEAGSRFPRVEVIQAIAAALKINESDLFRDDTEVAPAKTIGVLEKHLRSENEFLRLANRRLLQSMRLNEKIQENLQSILSEKAAREIQFGLFVNEVVPEPFRKLMQDASDGDKHAEEGIAEISELMESYLHNSRGLQLLVLLCLTMDEKYATELESHGFSDKQLSKVLQAIQSLRAG